MRNPMPEPAAVPESTEMLPCPFCDSRAIGPRENTVLHHWIVECINVFCCAKVNSHSEEAVVKAWNRRTPAASPVAGVSAEDELPETLLVMTRGWSGCGVCGGPSAKPIADRIIDAYRLGLKLAQPSAEGDGWIAEPTEQGWWWHIASDADVVPFMYCILKGGAHGEMFIAYPDSRWCSDVGGLWAKATPPALPEPVAKEGRES